MLFSRDCTKSAVTGASVRHAVELGPFRLGVSYRP